MKRIALVDLVIIALLLSSCIDPISLEVSDEDGLLVVDGLITNEPGPYQVKLTYSGMPKHLSDPRLSDAVVTISDDQGNQEVLEETGPGIYHTDSCGIQGRINRSYKLDVKLENGEHYESIPELLVPVPEIDSLYYKYITLENYLPEAVYLVPPNDGFEIYVNMKDSLNVREYYRWKTNVIYEHKTFPPSGPHPPGLEPPFCCRCFSPRKIDITDNLVLLDDALYNGGNITKPVAIVHNQEGTRVLVEVKQYSLSLEAYKYWEQINLQLEQVGDIFDTPPLNIRGNIINSGNKSSALGYFGASGVAVQTKMIYRNNYPSVGTRPMFVGYCIKLYPGTTVDVPPGFD